MAAPCAPSEYGVEIHFAQRLASNEKKTRDRTVKRLRHWLAARSKKDGNIGEVELMKLWKGLFYCMWMCDKPVIQEELADHISDMLHCFRRPLEACLFFKTFLETMRREWMGIDHLRLDKYLMLIRRIFRQMLVVLHNNEWEERLMKTFFTSLSVCVLNPDMDACPDGLRYQLANVYLDELAREGTEDLSPQQASTFLFPYADLVAKTLNKKLRDVILQDIFQDVVERSNVGEDDEDEGIASDEDREKSTKKSSKGIRRSRRRDAEDDDEKEEEDEEEDEVDILEKVMFPEEMVPPLEYDYGMIADKLLDLGSQKTIPPRNRKPIYTMVKRFQSLAKGVYPMRDLLKEIREEKDNEYLKDELPWWKKLQEREKKKKRRKRRRGKKGGKGEDGNDGDEGEEDEPDENGEEQEVVAKKKRKGQKEEQSKMETKKKKKQKANVDEQTEEAVLTEDFVEQTAVDVGGFTALRDKKTKGKKKKGTKNRGVDDKAPEEEVIQSGAASTEEIVAMETTSTSKRKKKKESEASKSSENINSDSKNNLNQGDTIGDSLPHDASTENNVNSSETPRTKSKKKGKKKAIVSSDADDAGEKDVNTGVDNASEESKVKFTDVKMSKKPFAAFEKVATPVAYVKKSKKTAEPCTLPRAKTQSRAESQFSPPMTRKRVKIALSMNQFQAANDYKQRIKLSPGVPFDGSKKPAFSVLKQTPPRSHDAGSKAKGSNKKSGKVTKRRSKAADFF